MNWALAFRIGSVLLVLAAAFASSQVVTLFQSGQSSPDQRRPSASSLQIINNADGTKLYMVNIRDDLAMSDQVSGLKISFFWSLVALVLSGTIWLVLKIHLFSISHFLQGLRALLLMRTMWP